MKAAIFALVALLVGSAAAGQITVSEPVLTSVDAGQFTCSLCTNFVQNGYSMVMQFIMKGEIPSTCGALCDAALGSVNKNLVQICTLGCLYLGEKEFIKLAQKMQQNFDPIYYCEEVKACPFHDGGVAKFDPLAVTPATGPSGTKFEVDVGFTVYNETSTGVLEFIVSLPDGNKASSANINYGFKPGHYMAKLSIDTTPSQNEKWGPGEYAVDSILCAGNCAGKHPHSGVYDVAGASWTITNSTQF